MKPITAYGSLCAIGLIISGCTTTNLTPEERQQKIALREDRRNQAEARAGAREEAGRKREAEEQRREEEQKLREKFARYSTGELKLMDVRFKELRQSSGRDLNVTLNPAARRLWGDSDSENIKRLLEIERELLRRWKAGDKEAYLPEFDSSHASNPQ